MTLKDGQIFANRYNLIEQIGTGGYSQVWLAADQMVGDMKIALKIYAPNQGLDEKAIQVFRDEYNIVFYLNHVNLLKPNHFDIFDAKPYLVLPYCEGGSLLELAGRADENQISQMLLQISDALNYLHSQNPPVLHRDIKPENILLDDKGNCYLSDFGISSKLRRTLTKSIGRQDSAGTTAFMAPEFFRSKREILPASDIFSLGVMLYELITDDLPFGQLGGVMLNSGAELPDMENKCSEAMAKLLIQCLYPEPQDRPTAKDIVSFAKCFLSGKEWSLDKPCLENEDKPRVATVEGFKSVEIGNQIWMAENLNVSHFRNGDPIPEAKSKEEWRNLGDKGMPAFCYYNYNSVNGEKYGKLYNWFAVNDKRGLSPDGWQITSENDWGKLMECIEDQSSKIRPESYWKGPFRNYDEFGFNAMPNGFCNRKGSFFQLETGAHWWTTTIFDKKQSVCIFTYSFSDKLDASVLNKRCGLSVRCVKET